MMEIMKEKVLTAFYVRLSTDIPEHIQKRGRERDGEIPINVTEGKYRAQLLLSIAQDTAKVTAFSFASLDDAPVRH